MNPDLKHCSICAQDLPVGDFGICRARKDGRNLYCMRCIREKVKASRQTLREYKAVNKRRLERIEAQLYAEPEVVPITIIKRETPVDRVREAIKAGYQTQREIAQQTKLTVDQVGEALATLMLWNKEIKSAMVGETRIYFFPESKPEPVVNRKPDVPSGFSRISAIMPERKRAVG